ncbi:MAG: VOC family protein [Maribacter sp.]|uniref:VOC family protein n=1 Tax=Maribacter sp. TaxID=1897614 RepID=UPI0032974C09
MNAIWNEEMIGHKIKGLGEIVLRVNDMELMKNFYQKTIGFELMNQSENYTFFKIADGVGGHTQTLALFAKNNVTAFSEELNDILPVNSTLHHFALEIEKLDYEDILHLCKKNKIAYVTKIFEWVKWRSIFIKDPESNIVEFVCHDPAI